MTEHLNTSDFDYTWDGDTNVYPFEYHPGAPIAYICDVCGETVTENIVHQNGRVMHMACEDAIIIYRQRVEARYERLLASAEKLEAEGQALRQRSNQYAEIMNGQPILIGHHSEHRHRRMIDKMHNWNHKAYEHYQTAKKLKQRAENARTNRAISSDDPAAVLKLREKLTALEANQAHMVAVNKIVRKLAKMPKLESLDKLPLMSQERRDIWKRNQDRYDAAAKVWITLAPEVAKQAGISIDQAERLLKPDFMGRIGYADYATKNNGAEIRRLKARIENLTKQTQAARTIGNTEVQRGDIRIVHNTTDNRVQIFFPGKPAPAIIKQLRARGFHWTPSISAWQRMISADAKYYAKKIVQLANAPQ